MIESGAKTAVSHDVSRAILVQSAEVLRGALRKIEHCLSQLNDEQLNWRPFEAQNSIANVILHLGGNVRQWIINGLPQRADDRHRPSEFSDRKTYSRDDLLARIRATVNDACLTLESFPPAELLATRRIQAFDTNVLAAVWDTVSHFVGHTHEIVYITRLQLKEKYVFQFVPKGQEQGGE